MQKIGDRQRTLVRKMTIRTIARLAVRVSFDKVTIFGQDYSEKCSTRMPLPAYLHWRPIIRNCSRKLQRGRVRKMTIRTIARLAVRVSFDKVTIFG
jgi:hypothetical protein